jgi:hypothetical protein
LTTNGLLFGVKKVVFFNFFFVIFTVISSLFSIVGSLTILVLSCLMGLTLGFIISWKIFFFYTLLICLSLGFIISWDKSSVLTFLIGLDLGFKIPCVSFISKVFLSKRGFFKGNMVISSAYKLGMSNKINITGFIKTNIFLNINFTK